MKMGGVTSVGVMIVRGLLVTVVIAVGPFVLGAQAAMACSCPQRSVAETVCEASAVYVAHPRLLDPLPGKSFRVQRTLKGPVAANVRVDVVGGDSAACGTDVAYEEHALVVGCDGPIALSLCSQHLAGSDAVEQAREALGDGTAVGWRPDPVWLGQWFLIVGAAAFVLIRRVTASRG